MSRDERDDAVRYLERIADAMERYAAVAETMLKQNTYSYELRVAMDVAEANANEAGLPKMNIDRSNAKHVLAEIDLLTTVERRVAFIEFVRKHQRDKAAP